MTLVGGTIERVRGMPDTFAEDYELIQQIKTQLSDCFVSYGYGPIDVPIIEYTDLHLRKSGLDVIRRLYDFTHKNRRLCLRPEMTASVVRAYVNELQSLPLPIRLYYVGPVFRYEKPQKGRYRQFTEMGIELIGANHSVADAEVIRIACKGLDLLGLEQYRLIVGHVGILSKFLDNLGLERRLRNYLLVNMESLRNTGPQAIVERLYEIYPSLQPLNGLEDHNISELTNRGRLAGLLQNMAPSEAKETILELISSMNINIDGSRQPNEIVGRLLTKLNSGDQIPRIRQALAFMKELSWLTGQPSVVLREAKKLTSAYGIEQPYLDEMEIVLRTLAMYKLDFSRLSLDLGLTRGLQYYTGTIFEIHHQLDSEVVKICGGGRYDDLAKVLGSQQEVPATGFAYGIERINLVLKRKKVSFNAPLSSVDALVIPVSLADYQYAVEIAERLRNRGIAVEIDIRGRSVKSNLQYAHKRKIPFSVILGSEERNSSNVTLRNMASRTEMQMVLEAAIAAIKTKD